MSGILGLAYASISVDKLPVFIDESTLTDKSFSFVLKDTDQDSYMTIPGYDADSIEGDFTFHNVVEQKYWALNLSTIMSGTTSIDASKYKAVIDSGTSVLVGPTKLVNQMLAGLPKVRPNCDNVSSFPTVSFTIDGTAYALEPTDYIL